MERIIAALKQKLFGNGQSEKVEHAQLKLELQQAEQALEDLEIEREVESVLSQDSSSDNSGEEDEKKPKRVRRYSFPKTVETVTETLIPDEVAANPQAYREIGQPEVTELLDVEPMKFIKRRIVRPRFQLREDRQAAPVVAKTPQRVISGGLPAVGLLVQVILAKYADHLPLYRQSQIFATRYQVEVSRKLMGDWVRAVAEDWLVLIYNSIKSDLRTQCFLHADETPIRCLDLDSPGGSRKGYLWVYVDRQGNTLYDWHMSRSANAAKSMLGGYAGLLQCDAYSAYDKLAKKESFRIVACMAHVRRKFHEAWKLAGERSAGWYILRIGELYQIDAEINADPQCDVLAERKRRSLPILKKIKTRLDQDSAILSAQTKTYEAVNYTLKIWDKVLLYTEEPLTRIDNNPAEQAIRPTKIGMKNWLFVGHPKAGQRSAILYTLMQNCKVHAIDPREYLIDVLNTLPTAKTDPDSVRALQPRFWKKQDG